VCFQQDSLDRAKRSEEEWLPAALTQIRSVVEMRDELTRQAATKGTVVEIPVILAYSANPALSTSTISACVHTGAAGVLRPPYDVHTAKIVRRMVRAAKEGRISSVVGLPGNGRSASPSNEDESEHKVILPPTALSMGGEHEGEKVLSGAYRAHRRGTSASIEPYHLTGLASSTPGRQREYSAPARKPSLQQTPAFPPSTSVQSVSTPITAVTPAFDHTEQPALDHKLASLLVYNPPVEQRRRSIDVSGLTMALKRAQRAFEIVKPKAISTPDDSAFNKLSPAGTEANGHAHELGHARGESHDEDACPDTHLAELLSAMYYQTLVAIEIGMEEYEA